MRFIRYLAAAPTLLLVALSTIVLLFYSLSVALGAERATRAVERDCIAEDVHYAATSCVDEFTDVGFRANR